MNKNVFLDLLHVHVEGSLSLDYMYTVGIFLPAGVPTSIRYACIAKNALMGPTCSFTAWRSTVHVHVLVRSS